MSPRYTNLNKPKVNMEYVWIVLVHGSESRWGKSYQFLYCWTTRQVMYGGFILHLRMLGLEVLIFTRTKNCVPARVETKWTRTSQPRPRAQLRGDLHFPQGHDNSSSGLTEEDNIICNISQLLGLPITFRVVSECGFLEGTTNTFLHAERICDLDYERKWLATVLPVQQHLLLLQPLDKRSSHGQ